MSLVDFYAFVHAAKMTMDLEPSLLKLASQPAYLNLDSQSLT